MKTANNKLEQGIIIINWLGSNAVIWKAHGPAEIDFKYAQMTAFE